jgi:hypothetical protein
MVLQACGACVEVCAVARSATAFVRSVCGKVRMNLEKKRTERMTSPTAAQATAAPLCVPRHCTAAAQPSLPPEATGGGWAEGAQGGRAETKCLGTCQLAAAVLCRWALTKCLGTCLAARRSLGLRLGSSYHSAVP